MDILLYFAFGALNIGLFFIIFNLYKRETGIDLFPGRAHGDNVDAFINIIAYFVCGYFGTAILTIVGVFLFLIWINYYRKK